MNLNAQQNITKEKMPNLLEKKQNNYFNDKIESLKLVDINSP